MYIKMPDRFAVQVALDGKHFHRLRYGTETEMRDYLENRYIKSKLATNPEAKFRLINLNTKKIIIELPKE